MCACLIPECKCLADNLIVFAMVVDDWISNEWKHRAPQGFTNNLTMRSQSDFTNHTGHCMIVR